MSGLRKHDAMAKVVAGTALSCLQSGGSFPEVFVVWLCLCGCLFVFLWLCFCVFVMVQL